MDPGLLYPQSCALHHELYDPFSRIYVGALADPGSGTAPGLPAMLLRIRLAATQASGLTDESRETARRLLADGVRVWDTAAQAALDAER